MANSATLVNTTTRRGKATVYSYKIVIDTTGQDLTIRTPTGVSRIFLVGAILSDGTAMNITFKSGSTTLCIPELTTNQALIAPVSCGNEDSYLLATEAAAALVIQSSGALTAGLLHVVEALEL